MAKTNKPEAKPELRELRAKGGFLRHLVPLGSRTALCGHTPTNERGRQFYRAGWRAVDKSRGRACPRCTMAKVKYVNDAESNSG